MSVITNDMEMISASNPVTDVFLEKQRDALLHDQRLRSLLLFQAQKMCFGAHLCHSDAEDLVQSTLLKAFKLTTIFPDEKTLRRYFCKTLLNNFLDLLRRKKTQPAGVSDFVHEVPSRTDEPIRQQVRNEFMDIIDDLLQVMDGGHIMSLLLYDELSYPEIAEITGLTVPQVSGIIYRSRRFMRAVLTKKGFYLR